MSEFGPRVAKTPLELLENDNTIEKPLLTKYFSPVAAGTVGFFAVIIGNWASKRPVMSGIQKHIAATLGLGAIGKFMDDYRDKNFAERDAVYRHYIQLHPEDFPPFERVKYKDLLEPWYPIR
nr:unnamed protein product [Callosobruchus chinensis]